MQRRALHLSLPSREAGESRPLAGGGRWVGGGGRGALYNNHRHTNIPSHASPTPRHSPTCLHALQPITALLRTPTPRYFTPTPRPHTSSTPSYTPTHLGITILHIHTPLQRFPTRPFAHKLHPRPPRRSHSLPRQHNAFSHTYMPPTRPPIR